LLRLVPLITTAAGETLAFGQDVRDLHSLAKAEGHDTHDVPEAEIG